MTNTSSLDKAAQYLHQLLTADDVPPPNPDELGNYIDLLTGLYDIHCSGGSHTANEAWNKFRSQYPELDHTYHQRTRFRLYHADELAQLPPQSWLIEGLIPEKGLTVLYGPSGSGKSFLTLDWAFQIAQEHPVIYIAGEGEAGYRGRIAAWKLHNQKSAGALHFRLEALPLLETGLVTTFIEMVRPLKPALIVIDTLARSLLGGDENSAKDIGILVEACATIQRELGCAILLVHHTGKSGNSERGSSALRGAADSMINIDNDGSTIKVTVSKTKDDKSIDPFYLAMQIVQLDDDRTSCVLVPTVSPRKQTVTAGQGLKTSEITLLETLAMETFRQTGARTGQLKELTDIAPSTMYGRLSNLMKLGYVSQHKKGDPFFITDKGMDFLATL